MVSFTMFLTEVLEMSIIYVLKETNWLKYFVWEFIFYAGRTADLSPLHVGDVNLTKHKSSVWILRFNQIYWKDC